MKAIQLFAMVLYCIDFVSGKDSAVIKVIAIKTCSTRTFVVINVPCLRAHSYM
jgi:hypothetical protein